MAEYIDREMEEHIFVEMEDDEIFSWVEAEKKRLGDDLLFFEVSWWDHSENEWGLILETSTKRCIPISSMKYGRSTAIATLRKDEGDLREIQKAGRGFYFKWRKIIPNLKRNLSVRWDLL